MGEKKKTEQQKGSNRTRAIQYKFWLTSGEKAKFHNICKELGLKRADTLNVLCDMWEELHAESEE